MILRGNATPTGPLVLLPFFKWCSYLNGLHIVRAKGVKEGERKFLVTSNCRRAPCILGAVQKRLPKTAIYMEKIDSWGICLDRYPIPRSGKTCPGSELRPSRWTAGRWAALHRTSAGHKIKRDGLNLRGSNWIFDFFFNLFYISLTKHLRVLVFCRSFSLTSLLRIPGDSYESPWNHIFLFAPPCFAINKLSFEDDMNIYSWPLVPRNHQIRVQNHPRVHTRALGGSAVPSTGGPNQEMSCGKFCWL